MSRLEARIAVSRISLIGDLTQPDTLTGALDPDPVGSIYGVHENDNFPLSEQPDTVLSDLDAIRP